jgi:hypothetical protein
MCFVWISEQTAIVSLYSINWLVFITETGCVYCAVRAGHLTTTHINAVGTQTCPVHRRPHERDSALDHEQFLRTQTEGEEEKMSKNHKL